MKRTILDPGRDHGRERGSVLITAIMVIVVMLIMAIPFLVKLSAEHRSTERASRALTALNLAEAGVDKVIWELNLGLTSVYDPTQDAERITWNGTAGSITGVAHPDSSVIGDVALMLEPDPDPTGTVPAVTRVLESTGAVPFIADRTVDRTVRVVLEKSFDSIFDYGFVIDESFFLDNAQLTVDSYDSRVANYDSKDPGDIGIIAILNDEPSSFIVDQSSTVNVTGAIYAGADVLTDGDPNTVPSDELADAVIDLPKQEEDAVPQMSMNDPFILPAIDLLTLHPKETWPAAQDISNWFTSDYVEGTQLPAWTQVNDGFKGADGAGKALNVAGSATLTAADNGIYTSFVLADTANVNVAAGQDVVIMVSEFAGSNDVAQFTMGGKSNITIGEGGSLTLILGRTSFFMGDQATINVPLFSATDDDVPGIPADCLILGMNAFAPDDYVVGDIDKKLGDAIVKDPTLSPVGSIIFEQHVAISAAMYTPLAQSFDLSGMNHSDIYGAWLTNSMYYKVAARFHYDEALGDFMLIKGGMPKWRIINWQEVVGN